MREITFEGIPSGDHEAFCWDVSLDEFVRLLKREPRECEKSFFNKDCFRVYPGYELHEEDIVGIPNVLPSNDVNKKLSITIQIDQNNDGFESSIKCSVVPSNKS